MAGTTQYKNDWQKTNLDRINLTVPKGRKERIQDYASVHGESVNGFIKRAVCEAIEREEIFEQTQEEIISISKEYGIDIGDIIVKKLAQAFAVLEPQILNIKNIYFSRLQLQEQSSKVVVIVKDGPVQ